MGAGKYSPTVSESYRRDRDWFRKNGGDFDNGDNPNDQCDNDGYDAYGYSGGGSGPDRAGYTENEYGRAYSQDDSGHLEYDLLNRVEGEWRDVNLLTDPWPDFSDTMVKTCTKIINAGEEDGEVFDLLPKDVQREITRLTFTTLGGLAVLTTDIRLIRTKVALAKAWARGKRGE